MRLGLLALVVLTAASPAAGQGLPTEPITVADGRVVIGAELSATYASPDPGFFNYTDYEYSALRNVRLGVLAEVRASRRVQLLGELRVDHGDHVQAHTLYVRVRPWLTRRIDVQVGRVPATFGAFGRTSYGTANLLIGSPLAYQYLTSLRADALPATPDDLWRMRGRGWLSSFPLGNTAPDRGLPIINSVRSDTGVQVHGVNGVVQWTGAITMGSLSNPRVRDDNSGRQLAGRVVTRPVPGLALGVSAARGAYVSDTVGTALAGADASDGRQRAFGADAEYAEGRFLARGEYIHAQWTLPAPLRGTGERHLRASSVLAEARYRVLPGLQLAGRGERLDFGTIATAARVQKWEAPVTRFEFGAGYSLIRNVTVRASWQRNLREGGRIRRDTLVASQVIYWF
jgi:hypothetical protein